MGLTCQVELKEEVGEEKAGELGRKKVVAMVYLGWFSPSGKKTFDAIGGFLFLGKIEFITNTTFPSFLYCLSWDRGERRQARCSGPFGSVQSEPVGGGHDLVSVLAEGLDAPLNGVPNVLELGGQETSPRN